jgi:hypothetical protein
MNELPPSNGMVRGEIPRLVFTHCHLKHRSASLFMSLILLLIHSFCVGFHFAFLIVGAFTPSLFQVALNTSFISLHGVLLYCSTKEFLNEKPSNNPQERPLPSPGH